MTFRSKLSLAATLVVLTSLIPRPAASQGSIELSVSDSIARIVPRQELDPDKSIRTQRGDVALLLTRSSVVIQMTDEGLNRIRSDVPDRSENALGRLVGAMARAGVVEMLDRGIAYPLRMLKKAYADGGRLYLVDRDGGYVFDSVSVNKTRPMEDFRDSDAKAFARKINKAIRESQ